MKRKEFLGLLGCGILAPLVAFLPKQENENNGDYLGQGQGQACICIIDENGVVWCEGENLQTYSWQERAK